jgi:hypothetical protein
MHPTCSTGKVCFTKRAAQGAINATYRNHHPKGSRRARRRSRPDNLRTYHCSHCNFYHLTSH